MSRADRSHVPYVSNKAHPFQAVALEMVNASQDLKRIRDAVRAQAQKFTPSLYDHAAIKKRLQASGDLDKLRALVTKCISLEPKDNTLSTELPKPPPARSLYGRIEKDTKIVDVGSGNAKRLIQMEGQFKVTTVDPAVEETRISGEHRRVKFVEPSEETITSFMALTNNEDQSAFEGSDGIHVVPDLPNLARAGFAERKGKSYITKDGDKEYCDFPLTIPSTTISTFYRGVNTYRSGAIHIRTTNEEAGNVGEFHSLGTRCVTMPAKPTDCSLKYNGVLFRYRKRANVAYLFERNGTAYVSPCDPGPDVDLWFEYTGGGPRLIRIEQYRNFRPFHSLAALEYFLQRVRVDVDGDPLLPPERFRPEAAKQQLSRKDVEGLVIRETGEDFLVRNHLGIDLKAQAAQELPTALARAGLVCDSISPHLGTPEEVVEYQVIIDGSNCVVEAVGYRAKNNCDDLGKLEKMLSWPTTDDILHLYDDDPGPISGFHVEELDDEPETDEE